MTGCKRVVLEWPGVPVGWDLCGLRACGTLQDVRDGPLSEQLVRVISVLCMTSKYIALLRTVIVTVFSKDHRDPLGKY